MKKLIYICLFLVSNTVFGQTPKAKIIPIIYRIYNEPLKIEPVKDTLKLKYSNPIDVVKSFYSADSENWIKSLYLVKPSKIIQNKSHFEAVRNRKSDENYAQIESWISLLEGGHELMFIKYSMKIKDLPFPLIAIMSLEKRNNRWYIADHINQDNITTVLSNFEPSILNNLLHLKSKDEFEQKVIGKITKNSKKFSFKALTNFYIDLLDKHDTTSLDLIRDRRLLGDGSFGIDPKVEATFKDFNFEIEEPFK